MKNSTIVILSLISLGVGITYFAINQEWIVVRHSITYEQYQPKRSSNIKKECTISYWRNHKWLNEKITLLWNDDTANNCKQLINALLELFDEEHIANKKITLDSVLISTSGQELFLSFSRNLFDKEEPLIVKWMRIESILKTIRNQGIAVQHVRFLVQHQPLRDRHLDFSQSWPLHGFCEAT